MRFYSYAAAAALGAAILLTPAMPAFAAEQAPAAAQAALTSAQSAFTGWVLNTAPMLARTVLGL